MNAVGKMLVVLQLCLSLLFVCFAGAAYSLQAVWRDKAEAAEQQVSKLQADLSDALADQESKVTAAETAAAEANTAREMIETDLRNALQEKDTAEGLLAEARQARDKAIAENERSTGEAASRRAETLALRDETAALQKRMAEQLAEMRQKDSQILDLTGLVNSYRQSEERLVIRVADLSDLLRYHRIDPDDTVAGNVPEAVEKVDGYVSRRRQSRSRTQEFVQITIGSDDKIKEGMILSVYRADSFVCDIRIQRVSPDTAIGIVVPDTRRSLTQEGDRVTTKL